MLDREACIVLNMISGIGYVKFSALCRCFGSPAAVYGRTLEELEQVPGISAGLAGKITAFDWMNELTREIELCDRAGVRIITLFDELLVHFIELSKFCFEVLIFEVIQLVAGQRRGVSRTAVCVDRVGGGIDSRRKILPAVEECTALIPKLK